MGAYKSYKICQGCNCAIVRGGVIIQERGSFNMKHYHKACLRRTYSRVSKGFFDVAFKVVKKIGEFNTINYKPRRFLGIKI